MKSRTSRNQSDDYDYDYFNEEESSNHGHDDFEQTQNYEQDLFNREAFEEQHEGGFPSRKDYHGHHEYDDIEKIDEENDYYDEVYNPESYVEVEGGDIYSEELEEVYADDALDDASTYRRSKYSAKMDRFLNNGIIITGILLIMVLLIAFLV